MNSDDAPFEIQLTEEQQALIHKITGEHAAILSLAPNPSDPTSGTGRALSFNWRISVDSGIPRQQWSLRPVVPPPKSGGAGPI